MTFTTCYRSAILPFSNSVLTAFHTALFDTDAMYIYTPSTLATGRLRPTPSHSLSRVDLDDSPLRHVIIWNTTDLICTP